LIEGIFKEGFAQGATHSLNDKHEFGEKKNTCRA